MYVYKLEIILLVNGYYFIPYKQMITTMEFGHGSIREFYQNNKFRGFSGDPFVLSCLFWG